MKERLHFWYRNNRSLPARILFYRDGVGEDQFAMVKREELAAIRAACMDVPSDVHPHYRPDITMVICTKRQSTRFYPRAEDIGPKRRTFYSDGGNFKPGLVVDDPSIRLPDYFDFWLQAHKPLQGTGRPCHYFVLENAIGYTPDQLQQIVSSIFPTFVGNSTDTSARPTLSAGSTQLP